MNTTTENTLTEERAPVEAGVIIKLDLDVHATQITVVQQVGGFATEAGAAPASIQGVTGSTRTGGSDPGYNSIRLQFEPAGRWVSRRQP